MTNTESTILDAGIKAFVASRALNEPLAVFYAHAGEGAWPGSPLLYETAPGTRCRRAFFTDGHDAQKKSQFGVLQSPAALIPPASIVIGPVPPYWDLCAPVTARAPMMSPKTVAPSVGVRANVLSSTV